jgi:hypothetical protein
METLAGLQPRPSDGPAAEQKMATAGENTEPPDHIAKNCSKGRIRPVVAHHPTSGLRFPY